MGKRRKSDGPPAQGDLFTGGVVDLSENTFLDAFPDEEAWRRHHEKIEEEAARVRGRPFTPFFARRPDDRPRCVLCGEPATPDSFYSSRLDGSVHPKCHEEWLDSVTDRE